MWGIVCEDGGYVHADYEREERLELARVEELETALADLADDDYYEAFDRPLTDAELEAMERYYGADAVESQEAA